MFSLTSEVAQHYLEIIKLLDGQWLLQGPLTSHSWFRLSATPYYFFFPIFALFRFHPLTLNFLWIITSVLLIPLNFFVVSKIFDKKTAWISTILLLVSPLFWNLLKLPGFFNFIIPLFYWLIWALKSSQQRKKSKPNNVHNRLDSGLRRNDDNLIWLIFFIIGLMSTLHAAALMFLPFFTLVFFILKRLSKKKFFIVFSFFLIPQIPFLINDYFQNFFMTRSLILWIPYKFFNFLTGKTIGLNRNPVLDESFKNILDFIKLNFLPENFHWFFGILLFLFIFIFFIKRKTNFFEKLLFSLLIFGLAVLFVHKNPPFHYFVPIAFIPIILFSRMLASINKKIASLIVLIITIINFYSVILSTKQTTGIMDYSIQEKIAKIIVKDAEGKKFSLSRQGPFDNYIDQFRQNYEYILWWYGNRPVNNGNLNYKIVENENSIEVFRRKNLIYKVR